MASNSNLVLIGMPGSGKSTIGVILAKRTSHDFVDTDLVIQSVEHRSLQDSTKKVICDCVKSKHACCRA